MAKDAALFDRLEKALLDVYYVCEEQAQQQPEALSHAVSLLLQRSSKAIGLQIISLAGEEVGATPVKYFYSMRDPGENKWTSLGRLEDYSHEDRIKMLGAIQLCILKWIKYLPELRHPSAVSRLRDGLHQVTAPFSRLCRLAHEQQSKRTKTSEPQVKQELELLLKAFWEDMDLAVDGLNNLDEAAIQQMRFFTNNDHWELALRHSLSTASNWLLHTRLYTATGDTTYNTTAFNQIAERKISDWLPLLEDLSRQIVFLENIMQADRARIKPNPYPAALEQYRANKNRGGESDQQLRGNGELKQEQDLGDIVGLFLQTLYEQKAFSSDRKMKLEEICEKALGKQSNPESYKKQASQLVKSGYANSIKSRSGGYWLTQKGIERAKEFIEAKKQPAL